MPEIHKTSCERRMQDPISSAFKQRSKCGTTSERSSNLQKWAFANERVESTVAFKNCQKDGKGKCWKAEDSKRDFS